MVTILGAGGAIGNELVKELIRTKQPFRLVGRKPKAVAGAAETISADLVDLNQTITAVAGSTVVFLLAGLKYGGNSGLESCKTRSKLASEPGQNSSSSITCICMARSPAR